MNSSVIRIVISFVGGLLLTGLLIGVEKLSDSGSFLWMQIYGVIGYLWLPALAFAAFFYPAGIHDGDGVGYLNLAFILNMVIYSIVFYGLWTMLITGKRHRRIKQ